MKNHVASVHESQKQVTENCLEKIKQEKDAN